MDRAFIAASGPATNFDRFIGSWTFHAAVGSNARRQLDLRNVLSYGPINGGTIGNTTGDTSQGCYEHIPTRRDERMTVYVLFEGRNKMYWYDAPTGGNLLAELTFDVSAGQRFVTSTAAGYECSIVDVSPTSVTTGGQAQLRVMVRYSISSDGDLPFGAFIRLGFNDKFINPGLAYDDYDYGGGDSHKVIAAASDQTVLLATVPEVPDWDSDAPFWLWVRIESIDVLPDTGAAGSLGRRFPVASTTCIQEIAQN